MLQTGVSKFKTVCLKLFKQVRRIGRLFGTVRHSELSKDRKKAFGAMKGTLRGPIGDLITPLEGIEWEALRK